ncbi:Methyltransferase type 11 [Solidesulfovibrio fructosivorans JJ]]|uniref:Methyltransferase type 11 n=1 Tax=Solidesulfovibrio fructosivorans JJ] TaxID=596151 RepID=E1JXM4_SOLFR|nr:class I SAM-dependent methyltransferase [Solidesulfovibrio fructosivorans]EFL50797.1 Methyltransferase type 11 [Solidesulfovibrio fructosivorans JJ]]
MPEFDYISYKTRLHTALENAHALFFDTNTGYLRDEFACKLQACPACNGRGLCLFMKKDGFLFDQCSTCGMVFLNPRLTDAATYAFYESEWINIYNETKFHGSSGAIERDRLENRYLLGILGDRNSLVGKQFLEVGPGGEGTLLHEASLLGCSVTGLELSSDNFASLTKRFGNSATLLNTTLEKAGLSDCFYDYVVMRDVLEHIPNPVDFLRELARILKPGGSLLIQVPNIEGLIYKFSGSRHTVVFGFEHPNYWSPRSLDVALQRAGFSVQLVEHESIDFTLRDICEYLWGESSFTTVFPRDRSFFTRLAYRIGARLNANRYIAKIGNSLFPLIADKMLKKGSVIKVLSRKEG